LKYLDPVKADYIPTIDRIGARVDQYRSINVTDNLHPGDQVSFRLGKYLGVDITYNLLEEQ
jgi:hypothetical protein